ncbi:DNA recombination protein RmuC [Candidatus Falkowbacteria bacterium]|nr:DNA recombination protein RmuC [Candidatus Falkowbacteria bacterium]
MNTLIIISIVVGLLAFGAALYTLYFLLHKFKAPAIDQTTMMMLQQQVQNLSSTLHERMDSSQTSLQSHLNTTSKLVGDVTEKLTKLEETNKQVLNFSEQLQSLEDILKNPKQRGILGEYFLESVLKNVLPPNTFEMQYKFKDGEIVDAALFVKDKIIPVDSKFSLENYNRLVQEKNELEKEKLEKLFVNDLKNRIVETSKYIRPSEGTLDFAFMFIPSEGIYYDLLINKVGAVTEDTENLIHRAASKYKVIIVSPTSFLAYLQTVLQGLRALKIEEQAGEIKKNVDKLQQHLFKYNTGLQKLGTHLSNAVSSYNDSSKQFELLAKDAERITGVEGDVKMLTIDKPID